MSFTQLQIKSGYSLMDSTITIDKLVERASELQLTALALTDIHVLNGVIPFYKACQKKGIKPIIGMTIFVENEQNCREKCILLAENNQGYQQLIRLSTWLNTNDAQTLDKSELRHYTDGLLGILPVYDNPVKQQFNTASFADIKEDIDHWSTIFKKDAFYLGIQDHGLPEEQVLNQQVKAFCEQYQIPAVVSNDVRYLKEEDWVAYDCLQAINHGQIWHGASEHPLMGHYLRSPMEMEQLFQPFWPAVLEETTRIAKRCHVTIDLNKRMLPSYPTPEQTPSHDYLKQICHDQIQQKYEQVTEEVRQRLEYELNMIHSMGFSDYFLIVWDFITYAKANNIMVGPGRGSSAGSLVAYALGITNVDPMKHQLLFERFLNPERVSMPDIDVDFSDHRRDEVIHYVKEKYGDQHVAQIITFGTFAARSLVRELIKTMNIDKQDAYFILKSLPTQSGKSLKDVIQSSPELRDYIKQSERLKQLFSIALKLEGLPRHLSTHAAGVVISENPLTDHVPLTEGTHGIRLTQYPMNDLESIGLLKMDFLGLRNLTLIERILESIARSTRQRIDLESLPENDPKTFDLLQQGRTNGVFQLESSGMKQVLRRLKPTEFEDIVAVNALYRPGPMDFIPTYINRKHQNEKITYPHSDLKPILEKTYGVLIYQEQIIQIAHHIAGYSLGQADLLRRAVSKKQHHLMEEQKQDFIKGCIKNGYEQAVSEELFAWIVRFANYGFPKSHAVAYSKISYQLAYLKAHYPQSFYAELLSSVTSNHEKIHLYIKEMEEQNISMLPPSINRSFGKFSIESDGIRMGLLSIKGIGHQVIKEIIRVRKEGRFRSLFDFCMRVSFQMVNRSAIEQLILAGTFDDLYNNRASLLASIDPAMEQGSLFREFQDVPQLFQEELELENHYVDIEDFPKMKKLADEKELVGIYLSKHPLAEYRRYLRANGYLSLNHAARLLGKKHIKSAAIIQTIKEIRTKRGEPMAFMTLNDEKQELEAVVFPNVYRQSKRWLEENAMIVVKGTIESRKNQLQYILNDIAPFDLTTLDDVSNHRLFIRLTTEKSNEALKKIKGLANQFPGTTPIIVYHEKLNQTYQLSSQFYINPTYECLQSFNQFFTKANVVLEKNGGT